MKDSKLHMVILDNHIDTYSPRCLNIVNHFTGNQIDHDVWINPYIWSNDHLDITIFSTYGAWGAECYSDSGKWVYLFHATQDQDINAFLCQNKCYDQRSFKLKDNVVICLHSGERHNLPNDESIFSKIAGNNDNSEAIVRIEIMDGLNDIKKKLNVDAMLKYWADSSQETASLGEALRCLLGPHPEQAATRITERINRLLFEYYDNRDRLNTEIDRIRKDNEFNKDMNIVKKAVEANESGQFSDLEEILDEIKSGRMGIPELSNKINNWLIRGYQSS